MYFYYWESGIKKNVNAPVCSKNLKQEIFRYPKTKYLNFRKIPLQD